MAFSHAELGRFCFAPSDMMDGRVLRLRQGLDAAGFHNVDHELFNKYASAFMDHSFDAWTVRQLTIKKFQR
jgi:porphobilinogen synthase